MPLIPQAGRALWHILHGYAAALPPGPLSAEQLHHAEAWLQTFHEALALAGGKRCSCHHHWPQLLAEHPPIFTTGAAFYQWTVDMHHRVNAKLGKQPWQAERSSTGVCLPQRKFGV